MNSQVQAQQLPFSKKIIYSLGQFGWSLASFGVLNLLNYFYVPPSEAGGERMFPIVIGAAAILGVIAAVSRLFDAVTDPLIAGWSDRSNSPMGRRRKFLAIGALPFAVLSFLVFFPPVLEVSIINTIWLFFTIVAFYFFMTMYVTPFFALMSELGHSPDERLQLSTMISVTWALGFLVGNQAYALQGAFESFLVPVRAFQVVIGIFAVVSLILMYLPVFLIDERKYCEHHVSKEGSFEAILSAFKNRNFRIFALSDLTYWLSLTFIQNGISYYVIYLLGLDKSLATVLMTISFAVSFLFYFPTPLIAMKTGKKTLMIAAFVIFAIVFLGVFFFGMMPLPMFVQGIIVMLIAAIPLAIFGILPNAIVADIADADGIRTGNYKAGIFFGARTFMSKVGASITLFLFPIIISFGGTGSDVTVFGVRLTGAFAFVFVLIGLILFLGYDEKAVLKTLATKEELSEEELEEIEEE
ncbi:MAG: MFS transporter [Spirochaetia bacterium]